MDKRVPVSEEDLREAMRALEGALANRVNEKGNGSFISLLEMDGSLDQELREFKDAVHAKEEENALQEALDLAVGCVFGFASVTANRRAASESHDSDKR